MSGGDPSAIRAQLSNLLGAYGYNLYADKNRLRADDLLVRQQAAAALGEAVGALRELRTSYHRRFIPPASRDQPFPPPERAAELDAIARLQDRLADLETRVRGMSVPSTDKVWERFRQEQTLLADLLLSDYQLIAPARELRDTALALTPTTWSSEALAGLEAAAARLDAGIRARATFVQL